MHQLKHTDFILVSDSGKEFPCNKIILAFQSKVFEANFEIKNPKKFTGTNENLNQRMFWRCCKSYGQGEQKICGMLRIWINVCDTKSSVYFKRHSIWYFCVKLLFAIYYNSMYVCRVGHFTNQNTNFRKHKEIY